jgi:hypothetical protein
MPCVYTTPIPLSKEPSFGSFSVFCNVCHQPFSDGIIPRNTLYGQIGQSAIRRFLRWILLDSFCCGTYQSRTSLDKAASLMKGYMRRLSRIIRARIAYVAVQESRPSGLGHHQIRPHWHFLIACPEHRAAELTRNAIALWTRCYGEVKIDRYDPTRKGAYYIAKLASQSGFDYIFENLDRLEYNGPKDLLAAAKKEPLSSSALKATPRYDSLVLRDLRTRHPIGSASERSSSSISRSDMGDCV